MTNEKQLENQEEVKMPWQGKVWLSIYFFGVLNFVLILVFNFFLSETNVNNINSDLSFIFVSFFINVNSLFFCIFFILDLFIDNFIFLFSISIFNLFLIISFLRGKKWSIVFNLFSFFFFNLFLMVEGFDDEDVILWFLIFLISLPLVYFQYFCLKHPYFNQNKKPREVKI